MAHVLVSRVWGVKHDLLGPKAVFWGEGYKLVHVHVPRYGQRTSAVSKETVPQPVFTRVVLGTNAPIFKDRIFLSGSEASRRSLVREPSKVVREVKQRSRRLWLVREPC